jgi:predicted PhzF superfamily epimerase YddE/YHI9
MAASGFASAQATVRVEPANLQSPRPLPEQTQTAAIRDYLKSWQSLRAALEQNRADLLDPDFVGTAREKLAETIQQQAALGIRTRYQDRAHDIQIVFYSPEGLSIELTDRVEYDVQVLDHDRVNTVQHISARYVIVITPAEVRWRVRVFQAALK